MSTLLFFIVDSFHAHTLQLRAKTCLYLLAQGLGWWY